MDREQEKDDELNVPVPKSGVFHLQWRKAVNQLTIFHQYPHNDRRLIWQSPAHQPFLKVAQVNNSACRKSS